MRSYQLLPLFHLVAWLMTFGALPVAAIAQSESFPHLQPPTLEFGNSIITGLEFLHDHIVYFNSESGGCAWNIQTGESLFPPSRPGDPPAIDFRLDDATALFIEDGALFTVPSDSLDSPQFVGDPNAHYTVAAFNKDGAGIIAVGERSAPNNTFVARYDAEHTEASWSLTVVQGSEVLLLEDMGHLVILEPSPDGEFFNVLKLIETETGTPVATANIAGAKMTDLSQSFIDQRDRLFVASGTGTNLFFVNAVEGSIASNNLGPLGFAHTFDAPKVSNDGRFIVAMLQNAFGTPQIYDTTTGEPIASIGDFLGDDLPLFQSTWAFSPTGDSLYILAQPGRIEKRDLFTQDLLGAFQYTNVPFTHLLLTPDESILIAMRSSGREDDLIVAFDTANASQRYTLTRRNGLSLESSGLVSAPIETIGLSPSGDYFYFQSYDTTAFFTTGSAQFTDFYPTTYGRLLAAEFVADRNSYLFIYGNGVLLERSKDDFAILDKTLYPNFRYADSVQIDSKTGRAIFKIGGGLYVLDPYDGDLLWSDPDFGFDAGYYAFSGQGKRLVVINPKGISGVFDFEQDGFILDFDQIGSGGWNHALSPDGKLYARTRSDAEEPGDRFVELYAIETGELRLRSDSLVNLRSLFFQPNSNRIGAISKANSSSAASVVQLFDPDDSSPIVSIPFHLPPNESVASVSISADGARLLVLTYDDSIVAIDLANEIASAPLSLREASFDTFRFASIATNHDGSNYLFIDRSQLADGGLVSKAQLIPSSIEIGPSGLRLLIQPHPKLRSIEIQLSDNLVDWQRHIEIQSVDSAPQVDLPTPDSAPIFGRALGILAAE